MNGDYGEHIANLAGYGVGIGELRDYELCPEEKDTEKVDHEDCEAKLCDACKIPLFPDENQLCSACSKDYTSWLFEAGLEQEPYTHGESVIKVGDRDTCVCKEHAQ